jgi:hypothetical protein
VNHAAAGKKLDDEVAAKLRVAGVVQLSHPSRRKERHYLISPNQGAGRN